MYMFSITEGNLMIRTMQLADVSAYIAKFGYPKEIHKQQVQKTKEVVKNLKNDEPDLNFTVLENGKIIGAVATRVILDSPTDAMVQVDLPNASEAGIEERVKDLFLKLVKKDYFYDNIYFMGRSKMGNFSQLGKRYQITGKKVG